MARPSCIAMPALVTRHVGIAESAKCRELQQQSLAVLARTAAGHRSLLQLSLQCHDAAPSTALTAGCAPGRHSRRNRPDVGSDSLGVILVLQRLVRAFAHAHDVQGHARAPGHGDPARCRRAVGERTAQQAQLVFAAHAVATQPEEVFHQARGNVIATLFRRPAPVCWSRTGFRLFVAQHPDVLCATTALGGNNVGGIRLRDARQSAGHHLHSIAGLAGIHAYGQRARIQFGGTGRRATPVPATGCTCSCAT